MISLQFTVTLKQTVQTLQEFCKSPETTETLTMQEKGLQVNIRTVFTQEKQNHKEIPFKHISRQL